MPNNKRPRKPMKHRPALLAPINVAVHPDQARNLQLIPHQELAAIREGRGTETSWHTATARLNVGYVLGNILSEDHELNPDPRPIVRLALDAMVQLRTRFDTTGKMIATGDELRAIGEGLNVTDELQSASTRRQQRDALRVVMATAT